MLNMRLERRLGGIPRGESRESYMECEWEWDEDEEGYIVLDMLIWRSSSVDAGPTVVSE